MFDIAVVGDRSSVSAFASLGMHIYPAETADEVQDTLRTLTKSGNFAVIYITESAAASAGGIIERYREETTPAIILIPGMRGNTGEGMRNVSVSVEKAVGSDILSN